jgi:hypothetical protein
MNCLLKKEKGLKIMNIHHKFRFHLRFYTTFTSIDLLIKLPSFPYTYSCNVLIHHYRSLGNNGNVTEYTLSVIQTSMD